MSTGASQGTVGRVVVVGGGAAGFFGAIACAEAGGGPEVLLLEKGPQFLAKVRISGGGRCNVTHACFDPRELARRYPRGGQALIGPLNRFQPKDTVAWFEARGVSLKTEDDGRMFPTTDDSATIVECLVRSAREAGVKTETHAGVEGILRVPGGGFEVRVSDGRRVKADRVLLATGGCRSEALGRLAVDLGHTLEPPVPSLFALHVACPWLRELAGVAIDPVEVGAPGVARAERGPLLVTHDGVSGPAVLRLSAWGARALHDVGYKFPLRVNWLPAETAESLASLFEKRRGEQGARRLVNSTIAPLTARLWERLVLAAGVRREATWAGLSRDERASLIRWLRGTEFEVTGKTLNKDEFVTCGGVRLSEVQFKTMESRVCPGLHFAGELLDVDGITGGFNFQAAWTTGWLAGRAMAAGAASG
ncbi:MAG: NAD(P)/FAD-dependent oxidoreductase [Verrucomicrobiales bacterium]|nr:NAD(P)/FAD-dependent oxidoreductase [Verrucomicrobiales bacterium]